MIHSPPAHVDNPRVDFVLFAREVSLGPRGLSVLDGGSTTWRWEGPGHSLEIGVAIGLALPWQAESGAVRFSLKVEDPDERLVYVAADGPVPLSRSTAARGFPARLNLASMLELPLEQFGLHRFVLQLDDQEPEIWLINVVPLEDGRRDPN